MTPKYNVDVKFEENKSSDMPFKITMIIEGDNEKQIKEIADMAQQLADDVKEFDEALRQ